MANRIHVNNYSSTITSNIDNDDVSIVVSSAAGLPVLTGGDTYNLTLDDGSGGIEIVTVTARSGTTLTVTRGAEDTTPLSFSSGTLIELRPTADSVDRKADTSYVLDILANESPSGSLVLLDIKTASNSSSIDFTDIGDYTNIRFILVDIAPGNDDVELRARTSSNNGVSYDSGASDYSFSTALTILTSDTTQTASGTGDNTASYILIAGGNASNYSLGNATGETLNAEITLYNPSVSTQKTLRSLFTYKAATGALATGNGSGSRNATSAVNAIRFYMESGNIASGTIYMYGFRKDLSILGDVTSVNGQTGDVVLDADDIISGDIIAQKSTPVSGDKFIIQDSEDSDNVKYVDFDDLPSGGGGGAVDSVNGYTGTVVLDTDDIDEGTTNLYASPTNIAAGLETATISPKTTPISADLLFIKDSEDSDALKTIEIGDLPGGGGGAVDSVNGQTGTVVLDTDDIISGDTLTQKSTPASGDKFIIQDGADSDNVKYVDFDDLPSGGGGISDGDKGDITVSSSGTVWTVDLPSSITLASDDKVYMFDTSNSNAKGYVTAQSIRDLAPTIPIGGAIFEASMSVSQSVSTSTFTKLALNVESIDTNGNYDPTTNYRFQPTIAGKYLIFGRILVQCTTASYYHSVLLYKNGLDIASFPVWINSSSPVDDFALMFAIIDMNGTTDYLELYNYQTSGGTRTVRGNDYATGGTTFKGWLIGA